jgi:hypothetical protein
MGVAFVSEAAIKGEAHSDTINNRKTPVPEKTRAFLICFYCVIFLKAST